jgi:GT2 family glycosyltransferase
MTSLRGDLVPAVSVVVSTFNRAHDLERTLPATLRQHLDAPYEVVVVDNASTDGTADVIRRLQARFPHLRAEYEASRGAACGRNRGIQASRAPIIAITDDDTEVTLDWLAQMLATFEKHPDIAYVGGRVLPQWSGRPPAWLTRAHWGPLAIVDYGHQRLSLGRDRPLCLLTANFGVRRTALDRVGLFEPAFRRCQDHELQLRMWTAGLTGLYDPALLAWTDVPEERLRKSYYRMWYRRNGIYHALMPSTALFDRPVAADEIISLWGVPAFVYRQIIRDWLRTAWSYACGREGAALRHETQLWYFLGYVRARVALYRRGRNPRFAADLWRFAGRILRRRSRPSIRRKRAVTRTPAVPRPDPTIVERQQA